jgi:hypothetical protein
MAPVTTRNRTRNIGERGRIARAAADCLNPLLASGTIYGILVVATVALGAALLRSV